jgi:hypothetical protein
MLPNHHLKKATAVTLALGAILPATATARPIGADPTGATRSSTDPATTANQPPVSVYSRPDKSMIRVTTPGTAPQAVVRIQTSPSGFDWGDAGIGAAGGLALAMLGVGGAVVVSQRRPRGNRQTTPLS